MVLHTSPPALFRSLVVSAPWDLRVYLSVTRASLTADLTAGLTWRSGITLAGSPVASTDFFTDLQIWEDGELVQRMSLPLIFSNYGFKQSSYTIRLSEVSWRSEVRLMHCSSGNGGCSYPTPLLPLFSSLQLSPPHKIKLR